MPSSSASIPPSLHPSTGDFKTQIPFFKQRYRVIAMDSRDPVAVQLVVELHAVVREELAGRIGGG